MLTSGCFPSAKAVLDTVAERDLLRRKVEEEYGNEEQVCFQGVRATDSFTIWKSIRNGWPVFGRDTSNSFFEDATKVRFWLFGWRRDFKEVSLNPFVRVTSNVDWRMNVGDGLGIITSESWFLLAISRLHVRVG